MAVTTKLVREMLISGSSRAKLYSVKHDSSTTATTITPGTNFNKPVGSYVAYSETSGVYTFVIAATLSTYASMIMFLQS